MIKKIKNTLEYYANMLSSINTHSKNMNINVNKNNVKLVNSINEINETLHKNHLNKHYNVEEIKFSIITASYNCGIYLDEYFSSLLKQKNYKMLQIIVVDDGSTDGTKKIIDYWKKLKFFEIIYVYQENSGQSIARNVGLKYATNEWVTFIDADDFVSPNYFSELARIISYSDDDVFIAPWYKFIEESNQFNNNHPLHFRFKNKLPTSVNINKNPEYINLSVSSTIFNRKYIKAFNIEFDKKIKPNFEDAYFYYEYLAKSNIVNVTFVPNIKYFYRKRLSNDSTIDLSKTNPERYLNLLENGYLKGLKKFEFKNFKMAVLYDLMWNCEGFLEFKPSLDYEARKLLLDKIFSFFVLEDIEYAYEKKLISKNFRLVLKYHYFGEEFVYVEKFYEIATKNIIRIVTFKDSLKDLVFSYDGKKVSASNLEYKYISHYISEFSELVDIHFYFDKDVKEIILEGFDEKINFENKRYTLKPESQMLFMDRIDKADDNAEAFYDYITSNKKEFKNIKFAISKDSKDWNRLSVKGYNLVDYGSIEFNKYYNNSDFIFSSAGDSRTIENYNNSRKNQRFIFLQHGIAKDDLSKWLFNKKFDVVVTSRDKETKFFKEYIFHNEVVCKSGLPRFDKYELSTLNEILISFTWRYHLENKSIEEIENSNYYMKIIELLNELTKNKITARLILHPNMSMMKELILKTHPNITIFTAQEIDYIEEYKRASIFITDYSSLAFDFAITGSKVLYYQFDKEEFFTRHTYKENERIFSYELDALGPVTTELSNLISNLLSCIDKKPRLEKFLDNTKELNYVLDHKNSERVFDFVSNKFR